MVFSTNEEKATEKQIGLLCKRFTVMRFSSYFSIGGITTFMNAWQFYVYILCVEF